MRDQMKFVNHLGEEIEFGKGNVLINENDFRSYQWNNNSKNDKIHEFKQGITHKTLPVIVFGKNALETTNRIFEITEKDVVLKSPGKMYIGDYYLIGYFIAANYSGYTKQNSIEISLKFVSDENMWFKKVKKTFPEQTRVVQKDGLCFPTDFSFDFAADAIGNAKWNVEHYAASNFEMIIYGPCTNPKVLVNGYPYQIFTELESNEYLILDSKNNTVTKYLANGTTANLYNSRQFTPSVFEKIPGGQLTFNWKGNFGFDITLYLERSEPKW
jgi:hypothetical protein